tara:strand:+ start:628 stop:1773 length:1146 start_codon:yes stop_codon:yes gene_type:complete
MNIEKYWLKSGDIFNIHTGNNSMDKIEYWVDSAGNKLHKPSNSDKVLHNMNEYYKLKKFKYTKKDLISSIEFHRLKIPGLSRMKRDNINDYLFNYMRLSYYTIKIQKLWSKYIIRVYNNLLGPAYKNYEISNNVEDFLTTEKIQDIDYELFFSFKDDDNFIYTFNLVSLYNLLTKSMTYNPYNRKPFSDNIIKNIKLKAKINSIIAQKHSDMYDKYTKKMVEIIKPSAPRRHITPTGSSSNITTRTGQDIINAIRDIFIVIDGYGNYTQCEWFLSLNPRQCRRFIYELKDLWFYRAQIPHSTRIMIYPPTGNPFYDISNNMNHNLPIDVYRDKSINIMNRILRTSSNEELKKLGALYILTALTIVSTQAANALPWLYASTQ